MSAQALRILHTEWSDGWGGQERRIVSEMEGMMKRGHHVVLATRSACRIREEAVRQNIPVLPLAMKGKFDLGAIRKLARYLKAERIQVVNTHSGIDSWIGALAAKLAGTPVLVRTRHLNIPLKRAWHNFVHFLPDSLVTCGETMRRHLEEGCGFPAEQLTSIPTGIDFLRFTPLHTRQETRQTLGIPEGDFLVLMVGVIRSVKRHEIALRAFRLLLDHHPSARLILAGEGPMQERIEQLAADLAIADRMCSLGHREDVPDLLETADLMLLTSSSEGVPQAITQALGLGVPVVATAVGGVPELVIHEHTGLLVPPEDPLAVAEAMARLADDLALATHLGEEGRRHVMAEFSLDAMLDKTEHLYRSLLDKKGAS